MDAARRSPASDARRASARRPGANPATVRHALTQGYRVYVELDAAALATFVPPTQGLAGVVVKGNATQRSWRRWGAGSRR